jgi:hypothetical protein
VSPSDELALCVIFRVFREMALLRQAVKVAKPEEGVLFGTSAWSTATS